MFAREARRRSKTTPSWTSGRASGLRPTPAVIITLLPTSYLPSTYLPSIETYKTDMCQHYFYSIPQYSIITTWIVLPYVICIKLKNIYCIQKTFFVLFVFYIFYKYSPTLSFQAILIVGSLFFYFKWIHYKYMIQRKRKNYITKNIHNLQLSPLVFRPQNVEKSHFIFSESNL